MRSFHTEFNDLFAEGLVSAIEVGLGASGELKYPSFSERMGWRYPGIGEFQVSIKDYPFHHNVNPLFFGFIGHPNIVFLIMKLLSGFRMFNKWRALYWLESTWSHF